MPPAITVALVGNPNAGKTTIFNALTGARQHVGNWPGVTVEKKEGASIIGDEEALIVDLPGTYSLTALSLEEVIARKFILEQGADVVIDVVDSSNLERNLYLAVQLMEIGVKIVIGLNMIDVARGRGLKIDHAKLSQLLGVPVVPTDGKREIGVKELLSTAVERARLRPDDSAQRSIQYGVEVEEELAKIEGCVVKKPAFHAGIPSRWAALKLLEGDVEITEKIREMGGHEDLFKQVEKSRGHLIEIFGDPPEIILTDARYGFISGAVKQTVAHEVADRVHLSETIDKVLTNRLLGPVVLGLILYAVYLFTFGASEPLVGYFGSFFKWLSNSARAALPDGLLRSLVASGVIDGVGGVMGFVPLIAFMFFAIAILEDTGYMARIAFMLDRVLRGFGLHGASMLALMVAGGLAGGCAVPGIMATRTLREPKERLTTILVTPLMNCGAKLPVYALLVGAFFPGNKAGMMLLLTLISWVVVLIAGRVIRSTVLTGPSAPFVLELPPYRVPTLKGLLIHTWERTWMYMKKAGTVILAISIVLWAVMTFPELPSEAARPFDQRAQQLVSAFLDNPKAKEVFKSEQELTQFEAYAKTPAGANTRGRALTNPAFAELAEAVKAARSKQRPEQAPERDAKAMALASTYLEFKEKRDEIERERQTAQLKGTIGGRIGTALEWFTRPINFDWRTNIALLGGFAAKEVVVATLGTAYSLGEVDPESSGSLQEKLRNEPGWNPLTAVALLLFVMFYAPCVVTLVVMKKETGSWKWPAFAVTYTTALAYCVALVVYTTGRVLGIGLG
jgi:ferrous iron transport protein B